MEIEERVNILETQFRATREELRELLLEIHVQLMEAQTPLPGSKGNP